MVGVARPRREATSRLTDDLPEPAGPSIAITRAGVTTGKRTLTKTSLRSDVEPGLLQALHKRITLGRLNKQIHQPTRAP